MASCGMSASKRLCALTAGNIAGTMPLALQAHHAKPTASSVVYFHSPVPNAKLPSTLGQSPLVVTIIVASISHVGVKGGKAAFIP